MADNDPILSEAADWSVDPELFRHYRSLPLEELREPVLSDAKARLRAIRAAIASLARHQQQEAFLASLTPAERHRMKERL